MSDFTRAQYERLIATLADASRELEVRKVRAWCWRAIALSLLWRELGIIEGFVAGIVLECGIDLVAGFVGAALADLASKRVARDMPR